MMCIVAVAKPDYEALTFYAAKGENPDNKTQSISALYDYRKGGLEYKRGFKGKGN